jgi:hypothetical protein
MPLARLLSPRTGIALRYGFLDPERARASREFLIRLDRGLSIAISPWERRLFTGRSRSCGRAAPRAPRT